ncbi:MAG TPA: TIGR04325 family methyltransferase [Steroidobacteraceae bacterium]|jgi:putative methyltransferase (TIGR04325 family)|nr:TIGR04325 family methyltransferase [Steroidobacteraceae bacterium]
MTAGAISRTARVAMKMTERLPVLRQLGSLAYSAHFNAAGGQSRLFRGIYSSFAEASRHIPPNRLEGYDNEPSAHRLAQERLRIFPFDYPVMFWLSRLLPECRLLFDLGGHVGISYFAYRRYLTYAADLNWLVCDMPAIVALGRKIAADESAPNLGFTTTLEQVAHADILLAAGSLHFIEDPFASLRAAAALPRHLILNKVPAYELPSAVTLHNMGSAFCPYHLFNRAEFVREVERLGYRLLDEWKSPDISCRIPYFASHSIPAYTGFYFCRSEVA